MNLEKLQEKIDSLPEDLKKKLDKTAAFESELSEDELDKVAGGAGSTEDYYDKLRALGWSEEDILCEKLREEAYAECKKRGFWGNCDKFDEIFRELLIKNGLLPKS